MTKHRFTPTCPAELRERGARLFRENRAFAAESWLGKSDHPG